MTCVHAHVHAHVHVQASLGDSGDASKPGVLGGNPWLAVHPLLELGSKAKAKAAIASSAARADKVNHIIIYEYENDNSMCPAQLLLPDPHYQAPPDSRPEGFVAFKFVLSLGLA